MNNFKEISRTLSIAICIALTACIACTALMFVIGVKSDIYSPPPLHPDGSNISEEYDPTLLPTHDYGDIYVSRMMIFCDHVLFGITELNLLKDNSVIISGKNGDMPLDFSTAYAETVYTSLDGKARSLVDAVSEQKPQYLLISIGLKNGVEHCDEEKFKQYYQKVIDAVVSVSPGTLIVLQSVLPVSQSVSKSTPALSINKIDKANEWIYEICKDNSLRYLNVQEALKNDHGYLSSEFDSGDGIHLNEQGYRTVVEYIKTHGYK